jgi:predicted RNase H-like nuclease (RuvC/YqgF family)
MSAELLADLNKGIETAIESTVEPLRHQREMIVNAIDDSKREQRELEAQLERVDRMLDAAKLRKKAGRPAGAANRRQRETVPAE